ncbi:MAG: VWA domain-containing protein [Planctomycetes bacterium]|nr:VWA domain-containing protein [Planctomycetota bacterium]
MALLNSYYLFGLLAVGVPILIHILQRDRVQRITFPAVRFLLGASQKITRTQRLRELLLMLLRAALVACLALALTRPFLTGSAASAGGGLGVLVLAVDTSGSMRIGGRLEAAKKLALERLAKCEPGARVGLVAFDHAPNVKVAPTPDHAQVRAAIEDLKEGYGGTNLVAAMQRADQLLQGDDYREAVKTLCVYGDFPRSGWASYDGQWRLSSGVGLELKPVAATAAENAGVTQVSMPRSTVASPRAEAIHARVMNFGAQDRKGVKVTLSFNGKPAEEKSIHLRPNEGEIVHFRHVFDTPGDAFGTITVDADDGFAPDNTYHFNVRVLPRIQVRVFNGGVARKKSEDEAHFLKAALSVEGSPFEVREIAAEAAKAADFEGCDAAVLTSVTRLPKAAQDALEAYLERGGGALFWPGESTELEGFNAAFASIAPCRLKEVVRYDRKGDGVPLAEIDYTHRIFRLFAAPQSGELTQARFFAYAMVTDSQLAQVRARYLDGRPALLERAVGSNGGMTLLFTSSAGLGWNDFGRKGGLFVPFVHEAVRYLAVRGEAVTTAQVGQAVVLTVAGESGELTPPEGDTVALKSGPQSFVPALPGLHVLAHGEQVERFAVNLDPDESDTTALDPEEVQSAVSSNPEGEQRTIDGVKVLVAASGEAKERMEKGQGWGWYVLVLLVVGLVGEHILANHTSRN